MANKNIQMKKRNGQSWDNMFPVTLDSNVFDENGNSVKDELGKKVKKDDVPYINLLYYGVIPDKLTDNTTAIQNALNSLAEPSIVLIPLGTKWDYRQITHPQEVVIWDLSTYDWKYDKWTAQQKYILNTGDPQTKNAHEFITVGPWHPAFVVDNIGGELERRASIIFRQNGVSLWRAGKGITDTDDNFLISEFPAASTRFSIKYGSGETAFNSAPVNDVSYYFKNPLDSAHIIRFATKSAGQETELQFHENGVGLISRIKINPGTGMMQFIDSAGATNMYLETNGTVYGNKNKIIQKSISYSLSSKDSKVTFTNEGSSGGFLFNLPAAEKGLEYSFCNVVNGNNIRIIPNGSDSFRDLAASKHKETSVEGSYLNIKCCINGIWEVISEIGTWIDQI